MIIKGCDRVDSDYRWCRNCKNLTYTSTCTSWCLLHDCKVESPNSNSCSEFELYTFSYFEEDGSGICSCSTCNNAELTLGICKKHDKQVFEPEAEFCESWEKKKELKECSGCSTEQPDNYKEIANKVAELVKEKNKAYGNSFGETEKFLKILYPDGVPVDKYKDMLSLVRIWDKIKRIATDKDALGESPYEDILGYCILAINNQREGK